MTHPVAAIERLELERSAEAANLEADRLHDDAAQAHAEGREADADYMLRQAAAYRMEAEALEARIDAG